MFLASLWSNHNLNTHLIFNTVFVKTRSSDFCIGKWYVIKNVVNLKTKKISSKVPDQNRSSQLHVIHSDHPFSKHIFISSTEQNHVVIIFSSPMSIMIFTVLQGQQPKDIAFSPQHSPNADWKSPFKWFSIWNLLVRLPGKSVATRNYFFMQPTTCFFLVLCNNHNFFAHNSYTLYNFENLNI